MQPSTDNMLDVTTIEPRMKHPTIFSRFDALAEGQSLTIHNDHDPKPLYYQMLGERGNVFHWEYLEQGPEWWKVRITKRVAGAPEETLGQMAVQDLRKVEVFKKYGLDFCCGGKKTLKEACAEKGLDVVRIEQELQAVDRAPQAQAKPLPYSDWGLDFLADYIVNTHHHYVQKSLPDLRAYADKVATVHGDRHPELTNVQAIVQQVAQELTSHMMKEERVLFPYIKSLVAVSKGEQTMEASPFGTVRNPVNMMEMEHDIVARDLEEIRAVTHNYALPDDACGSYRLLFQMLDEFEQDLHLHVHLENNILFPKAIELEAKLFAN
ncbi:MAG: Iron-sulfur cluster repair protein YtfE [Saprospiraceae bacterium]|jgi:regulator of cell morphogenesis and NO signaling|nr:Iron-sulfur cluster repair protein YtfE [Saprospiraceae bacterium]